MRKAFKPVIYIVGPTASGKTALSVKLAKKFGGEIVCADSMQIYKGMPIATAAPTENEKCGVPHRMFEFLEKYESYSVSQYVNDAKREIDFIHKAGKPAFVVGGTGLYINSLSENIDFGSDISDCDLRKSLKNEAAESGLEALYIKLKSVDPKAAEKISPNDEKRIIRALEVYLSSGETISERAARSKTNGPCYDNLIIETLYRDRQKLYDRINKRVDIMLSQGLIEEAKNNLENSGGTSVQAIGHKELFEYFKGNETLSEATEMLKQQTRRYAKRQITWFGQNESINRIYMDETENAFIKASEIIEKFLSNK